MSHVQRSLFWPIPYVKCFTCGYKGKGKYYCPWSFFIEIILWLFFLVPWLIYSIWRLSNRGYICKQCGNQNVVKISKEEAETAHEQSDWNKYHQLEKLGNLKEKWMITEEEFLAEKIRILWSTANR